MNSGFTHHTVFKDSKNIKPIEVFIYELDMLNKTHKLLGEIAMTTQANHNALIESFLLHTRSLMDFFERDKEHKDDITISDFKDNDNNQLKPIMLSIDKSIRTALNKYLAHMTTLRMTDEVTWRTDLICKELNMAAYLFIEKCNENCFKTIEQKSKLLEYIDGLLNA